MLRTLTLAALLALGATAAQAEDVSTQVTYGDLDLSKPSDAKTLAARLQDAATAVCMKANPENPMPMAMQNCVNLSVHMAMTRIQNDMEGAVAEKISLVRTAMRDARLIPLSIMAGMPTPPSAFVAGHDPREGQRRPLKTT